MLLSPVSSFAAFASYLAACQYSLCVLLYDSLGLMVCLQRRHGRQRTLGMHLVKKTLSLRVLNCANSFSKTRRAAAHGKNTEQ